MTNTATIRPILKKGTTRLVPLTLRKFPPVVSTSDVFMLEGPPQRGFEFAYLGIDSDSDYCPIYYVHRFDSNRYDCQWHQIEFPKLVLPTAAELSVFTYTWNEEKRSNDEQPARDIDDLGHEVSSGGNPHSGLSNVWSHAETLVGEDRSEPAVSAHREVLIQSGPGRFLDVLFLLRWNRPNVDGIDEANSEIPFEIPFYVSAPRQSWLEFLPAVFRSNPTAASFLERFLASFQVEADAIEHTVKTFGRYLDPERVPDEEGLRYLAAWFDIPLEAEWDLNDKRSFLKKALHLRARRGTPDALIAYLRAWFESEGFKQDGARLPRVVEGFRIRRFVALNIEGRGRLRRTAPLGPELSTSGAQLDVGQKLGMTRLPGPGGGGATEMINYFGHRVRGYVPALWMDDQSRRLRLQQFLGYVVPAHIEAAIVPVAPGFILGANSLLGLNTIPERRPTDG
jgi:phage tail-like protein